MKRKEVDFEIVEQNPTGGRILINTASVDRDLDRVLPMGAEVANYLKNPVVQWGHNYRDPWATIGKTVKLEITEGGIVAEFELRPAANESDPQSVVLLLWEGGWINTASIGFNPDFQTIRSNDLGGLDFPSWELLEWSLVPIPANQDALRLAVKAFTKGALSETLNELVDGQVSDDQSRADIIAEMGEAAGIAANTVNEILSGDIMCPPLGRLESFASVLDTSTDRLVSAAEEDGCTYNRSYQHRGGGESPRPRAEDAPVQLPNEALDSLLKSIRELQGGF